MGGQYPGALHGHFAWHSRLVPGTLLDCALVLGPKSKENNYLVQLPYPYRNHTRYIVAIYHIRFFRPPLLLPLHYDTRAKSDSPPFLKIIPGGFKCSRPPRINTVGAPWYFYLVHCDSHSIQVTGACVAIHLWAPPMQSGPSADQHPSGRVEFVCNFKHPLKSKPWLTLGVTKYFKSPILVVALPPRSFR